jgi:MFS family permease
LAKLEKPGLYYGWKVLAALFVVGAVGPQARYGLTAFFPLIAADTGWSRSEIGLAQSIGLWSYAVLSIPAGLMVDRFGGRKTILLGGLVCLLGWLLMASIHSLWQLYFYYGFVMAAVTSLTHLVATQATSRKWFVRRAGLAAGIVGSAFAVGNAILTPVLTSGASSIGWRTVSVICGGAFSLPILLLAYLIIRDTPESVGLRPDGDASPQVAAAAASSDRRPLAGERQLGLKDALKTPQLWLLFAAYSFSGIVINGLLAHLVVWVTDFGTTAAAAGLFVTLYNAPSMLSRVGGGWLGDRFGKSRILVIGAALAFAIMLVTWLSARGVGHLLVLVPLMGLGLNLATGLYAPHLGDLFGRRTVGALFAILTAGWGLIGGLGPLIWGLIYDRYHGYSLALLLSLGCYLLATAALLAARYLPWPARRTALINDRY